MSCCCEFGLGMEVRHCENGSQTTMTDNDERQSSSPAVSLCALDPLSPRCREAESTITVTGRPGEAAASSPIRRWVARRSRYPPPSPLPAATATSTAGGQGLPRGPLQDQPHTKPSKTIPPPTPPLLTPPLTPPTTYGGDTDGNSSSVADTVDNNVGIRNDAETLNCIGKDVKRKHVVVTAAAACISESTTTTTAAACGPLNDPTSSNNNRIINGPLISISMNSISKGNARYRCAICLVRT
eukprot:GHVU01167962.1.p1 GENE.GHVU01167962.1~~GHVU01167962.1.p1  ORF type:complete len:241 (+),score=33.44 GHVU01167962.1:626-1348(+)